MSNNVSFDELLDAVEHLSTEEQAEFVGVIQRRLAEQGRQRVVEDVRQARAEFQKGSTKPATIDSLIHEIDS